MSELVFDGQTLKRGGVFVCNDTALMRRYYEWALSGFHGSVFMTGLGLGVAARYVADLEAVESVTVLENDPAILGDFPCDHPKVRTILADAWGWPPSRFDCAFHDIWSKWREGFEDAAALVDRYAPYVPEQVALPLTYEQFITEAMHAVRKT
jgi:hypothetical protein